MRNSDELTIGKKHPTLIDRVSISKNIIIPFLSTENDLRDINFLTNSPDFLIVRFKVKKSVLKRPYFIKAFQRANYHRQPVIGSDLALNVSGESPKTLQ